jgi:hypothetical protein
MMEGVRRFLVIISDWFQVVEGALRLGCSVRLANIYENAVALASYGLAEQDAQS